LERKTGLLLTSPDRHLTTCCCRINNMEQTFAHPQVAARGITTEMEASIEARQE
jgi:crotonobetainyl-CoA:carnitine CoA-transferase CaiB-like acyl-CoA transferase